MWIIISLIWGSDISNRARVLLSKWSKLFARNHVIKKPNGVKTSSDGHKEMMLSQRQACILSLFCAQFIGTSFLNYYDFYFCSIGQLMGSESWHSNIDVPVSVFFYMFPASNAFSVCMFLSGPFVFSGRHSCSLKRMFG